MAPGDNINKPKNTPAEIPTDPIDRALYELQQKNLSHGQIVDQLGNLKQQVEKGENGSLNVQRLPKLKEAVREEVETGDEAQELSNVEKEVFLKDLDSRVAQIEQIIQQQANPDRTPKLVKQVKEKFEQSWGKIKEGVTAIGEFMGVTVPEKAGDAWNFLVKQFWKVMAAPTSFGMKENFFTKIAQEKVNRMDIWEGVREFGEQNKQIVMSVFEEDCNKAYKQLAPLLAGFPGANMYERVSAYLRKYVAANPGTPENKTTITMERLLAANLTNNFSVPSGSPETQQNLFGINGLKLNQNLPLTSPVEMQIGQSKIRIASDSVNFNNVQYKVKVNDAPATAAALTAKDAQNIGATELRHNGGDLAVSVQDIVNNLQAGKLAVKHLTFEKI